MSKSGEYSVLMPGLVKEAEEGGLGKAGNEVVLYSAEASFQGAVFKTLTMAHTSLPDS